MILIRKNEGGVTHLNQIWIYEILVTCIRTKKTDSTLYDIWKKEIYL